MEWILWFLLVLCMGMVIVSLICGLWSLNQGYNSQKWMRLRVVSQGATLIVFAILLKWYKN